MALGTFIAGRYTTTLNSVDLGIMENGYELQMDPKHQLINRSDAFGDTLIDTIVRGVDWSIECLCLEYKTVTKNAIGQINSMGVLGVIGRLGSAIAQSMVLTSVAGTPAAAEPATLTAAKTLLAPNANPRILFNSELRKVPLRWVFIPYDASGTTTFFVQT